MKKISVIIPVYNRLEHLRAGFICLLNQTVKPYELIISDDGSSEKVMDFIGDLIEKADFKIKHIYQEDRGFRKTRALNNAVRNAEGEILVFCDQDLIFPDDHLENISKNLKDNEFLLYRPFDTTEEQSKIIIKNLFEKKNYNEILEDFGNFWKNHEVIQLKKDRKRRILYTLKFNKRGIKLVGMSYALHRENYIKINGYDEEYQGWGYEDDDFGNRLYSAGIKGRETKDSNVSLHLWHPFDSTKKMSANENRYREGKKSIFKEKKFRCRYGYENPLDKDEIIIKILG